MVNLNKKSEFEIIKSRLQKAYSMTLDEQKKWSKKIKELESQAATIESELGMSFNDDDGIKLLIKANKELSIKLTEYRWGADISKFLEENPKVKEVLDTACDEVDRAFGIKSMEVLKLKIDDYKKAFIFVEKSFAATCTLGLRELTLDESQAANRELNQIGWM